MQFILKDVHLIRSSNNIAVVFCWAFRVGGEWRTGSAPPRAGRVKEGNWSAHTSLWAIKHQTTFRTPLLIQHLSFNQKCFQSRRWSVKNIIIFKVKAAGRTNNPILRRVHSSKLFLGKKLGNSLPFPWNTMVYSRPGPYKTILISPVAPWGNELSTSGL